MEVDSGQNIDANSYKPTSTSKISKEPGTDQITSPDSSVLSPLSKSRYGRTRKPKITEDFYNIDVIFETAREPKKSVRSTPQTKSPVAKSIKTQTNQSNKPKISAGITLKSPKGSLKPRHFVHVTGDTVIIADSIIPSPLPTINNASKSTSNSISKKIQSPINSKTVRKFFKRELETAPAPNVTEPKIEESLNTEVKQNDSTEVDALLSADARPLNEDVTKVLKIISTKSPDLLQSSSDVKGGCKPILKTYSNKRKNFQKMSVVESFGLPDKPIFPLENEKSVLPNEPKRIKNLDVATPSSENDINLVDKKLLDTPWKIASMNTDFADSEILLETCSEDPEYEEDKTVVKADTPLSRKNQKQMNVEPPVIPEINKNVNKVEVKPNKTKTVKKVSSKKQKQVKSREAPIATESSENLKTEEQPIKMKTLKSRSPRKQKQSVPEESPVVPTVNLNIPENSKNKIVQPHKLTLKNKSPRKQKQILCEHFVSSSEIVSDELICKEVTVNETKSKRNRSPKKQKQTVCEEYPTILPNTLHKGLKKSEETKEAKLKPVGNKSPRKYKQKQITNEEPLHIIEIEESPKTKGDKTNEKKSTKKPAELSLKKRKRIVLDKSPTASRTLRSVSSPFPKELPSQMTTQKRKRSLSPRKSANLKSPEKIVPPPQEGGVSSVEQVLPRRSGRHQTEVIEIVDKKSKLNLELSIKIEDCVSVEADEQNHLGKKIEEDLPITIRDSDDDDDVSVEIDEMNLIDRSRLFKCITSTVNRRKSRRSMMNKISVTPNVDKSSELPLEITEPKEDVKSEEEDAVSVVPMVSGRRYTKKSEPSVGIQENCEVKDEKAEEWKFGKSVYELEIKTEPEDVELGDLMWARIGGHPYWPCVVSADPISDEYKRNSTLKKKRLMWYHVRFFGDRGRRSWVYVSSMLRYTNKNDLKILYEKVKAKTNAMATLQPYIIKSNTLLKWESAVAEAEALKFSTPQERFDFFFNMFASEKERKTKLLTPSATNITKDSKIPKAVKVEVIEEVEENISRYQSPKSRQRRSKIVSPSTYKPKQSINDNSLKIKKEDIELQVGEDLNKPVDTAKSAQNENDNRNDNSLKPPKKGVSKSTNKQKQEVNVKKNTPVQRRVSKIKERKESNETTSEDSAETFLKSPWQSLDMPKRHLSITLNDGISECSLSDTDSLSKSSSNTPIPNVYKAQVTRQRRNNLFRGIPRHRVCQVCKKPGDVLKCKGPCSGLFHNKCADGWTIDDFATVVVKQEPTESGSSSDVSVCKDRELKEDKNVKTTNGIHISELQKIGENMSDKIEIEVEDTKSEVESSNATVLFNGNEKNKDEIVDPKIVLEDCIEDKTKEEKVSSDKGELDVGSSSNKVEIVHVDCDDSDFEHNLTPKVRLTPNIDFGSLSLSDQIDLKMKEVMQKLETKTRYADSTTDYTSSEESTCNLPPVQKVKVVQKKKSLKIKHVTADYVSFASNTSTEDLMGEGTSTNESQDVNGAGIQGVSSTADSETIKPKDKKNITEGDDKCDVPHVTADTIMDCEASSDSHSSKDFKCGYCTADVEPPCFVCHKEVSSKNVAFRQKCSLHMCGKFYHPECLKMWPQTQWSLISTAKHKNSNKRLDTFVCPAHVCHTCASDNPHVAIARCTSDKVVKCLRCPATYHTTNYCVPAGTLILSTSQIVCPRHLGLKVIKKGRLIKYTRTINTPWCFICSKGGDLICCETCPTSVHPDCLQINLMEDGTFVCEDCETGRFPLYDEIVWVKLGTYRWWPAVILFPNEVPANVKNIPHSKGEFVVKFFGTHDHYWVSRGRVFLFQEGDRGHCSATKNRVDALFNKSIEEAAAAHQFKKVFKSSKEAEIRTGMKPPPYIRVKVNKPVGNVRLFDGNISNTTSCECDPNQDNPCGPDSDCLNRLLLTECDPNICPAKEKCNNQRFEKRQYPLLVPFKTPARGWGLKSLVPIRKGDFVIEYVGEIIDDQEYQRRIGKMHEQKDENYYFLTIDKDRIIDAGPKGNLARFMNHCCQPNCETQKWTVNGDTRVGLFAVEDIPVDAELTFNYNLECIGKEKKICKCGAPNCSGFIGVKAKLDESQKKPKKSSNNFKKKRQSLTPQVAKNDGPCFICGQQGDVGPCHNKMCTKYYHLQCVSLEFWPEGKWVCPWHNCNICSKRTIRCCVKCLNSYCPVHSEGNVRHDKLLGFICSEHDPTKESQELSNQNLTNVKNSTVLTTEETDVTSTTPDEMDSNTSVQILKNIDDGDDEVHTTDSVDLILTESVTSTPIKKKNVENFVSVIEDFTNEVLTDKVEDSKQDEQVDDGYSKLSTTTKRKRGRQRRSAGNSVKKMRLSKNASSESVTKPKPNFTTSNLLDIPAQNEVKLSSSVPTRHLRTTRNNTGTNVELKRFLNRQSELEKDLPIRKRSRPRCEAPL